MKTAGLFSGVALACVLAAAPASAAPARHDARSSEQSQQGTAPSARFQAEADAMASHLGFSPGPDMVAEAEDEAAARQMDSNRKPISPVPGE